MMKQFGRWAQISRLFEEIQKRREDSRRPKPKLMTLEEIGDEMPEGMRQQSRGSRRPPRAD